MWKARSCRPEGIAHHLPHARRHANHLPPDPSDRRAADAGTVLCPLTTDDVLPFHEQPAHRPRAARFRDFVYIDHRDDVALVGTLPAAHGEDVIALGNYYLDPKSNRAEVAFVVLDNGSAGASARSCCDSSSACPPQRHPRFHRRSAGREQRHAGGLQQVEHQNPQSRRRQSVISYEMDFE